MKTNIVAGAENKGDSARNGTKTIRNWRVCLLFSALAVTLGVAGCDEYYGAYPGYRPYYGSYGPYGHGYYAGRTYYVWRPGHWAWRYGQRVWIRGHYVLVRR